MYVLKVFVLFSIVAAASAEQAQTQLLLTKAARVPGVRLKAGTYTVRVLESLADRFILQVVDDHRSRPLATFLAIPDANLPHLDGGKPLFWNNHGRDAAVRGIWLPTLKTGAQFVFEKEEAAKLAKQYREAVPAVDPSSEGIKPLAKMSDSDRQIVSLWLLSAVAVTPNGEQTGIQAVRYVPETQSARKATQADVESQQSKLQTTRNDSIPKPVASQIAASHLPSTASNFALYLLLGICFVGYGTYLRIKFA